MSATATPSAHTVSADFFDYLILNLIFVSRVAKLEEREGLGFVLFGYLRRFSSRIGLADGLVPWPVLQHVPHGIGV